MMFLRTCLALALFVSLLPSLPAEAKTKSHGWSNLSPEQKHKIAEMARTICKKHYGAGATVWRIDWSIGKIWCLEG